MGIKKEIKSLKDKIEKIEQLFNKEIVEKATKLDEIEENLKSVNLKIKSAKMFVTETGEEQLKVEYEIDSVYLRFDQDNNIMFNPTFYSINMLNLISPADMQKISKAIEKAKFKKK